MPKAKVGKLRNTKSIIREYLKKEKTECKCLWWKWIKTIGKGKVKSEKWKWSYIKYLKWNEMNVWTNVRQN